MEEDCKTKFTAKELEIYLPEEIKERFFKFREQYKINMSPELKWCPNNTCDAYVNVKETNGDSVVCEKCNWKICTKCYRKYHTKFFFFSKKC